MSRRFALFTDQVTKEQENAISRSFAPDMGYWHWLPNSWLLYQDDEKWDAQGIREKIRALVPGVFVMVIEIQGGNKWAAFAPPNWYHWMHQNWKPDPPEE